MKQGAGGVMDDTGAASGAHGELDGRGDERLAALALAGDARALAVLVGRHKERLFALLAVHVPGPDVERMARRAFAAAFQGLSSPEGPLGLGGRSFGAWLTVAALGECARYWREAWRRGERPGQMAGQAAGQAHGQAHGQAPRRRPPGGERVLAGLLCLEELRRIDGRKEGGGESFLPAFTAFPDAGKPVPPREPWEPEKQVAAGAPGQAAGLRDLPPAAGRAARRTPWARLRAALLRLLRHEADHEEAS
ncbi:hypothetical protein dsx2_1467 [Desulfovibrio sp. X2]|uniref:hypothetical protein n=1 Tax=Desulfovibrio sp. X2 TaxID=941449 RepID=UPI0003587B31|nr:hypothetical protein [Desulfovibrio sp. X2]EPR44508.1 hypothetical protein dsx2_1467 [Desulfovibrio sp. X2]